MFTIDSKVLFPLLVLMALGFKPSQRSKEKVSPKIPVIFDTDANNELDDQHALAYLLFSGKQFAVKGITVNATYNGGNIDEQYVEAERILKLANLHGKIPLLKGANEKYTDIKDKVRSGSFDGDKAVNFIISKAQSNKKGPLVLIAVGKLTNVALALQKAPSIAKKIRVVWLGSNYPEPGEYNQDNDTASLNYVLNTNVPFEMVTVRYGKPSGTDAVRVTQADANQRMPGKGPRAATAVVGRHGGSFNNFGDYSINLFEHIKYYGNPPARALFDMAAVAIVKNATWASAQEIPAPILINNKWIERPNNKRKIKVWENFKSNEILSDFYSAMDNYVLASTK